MSDAGDKAHLSDMLDCAEQVAEFIQGYDEARYLADRKTQAAVEHMLQTIGEAAIKVSDTIVSAHPEIDWFKIRGLRHRIVHDYRRINNATIYHIATDYVPPLVGLLKKILASGVA